jgi:tRNA dimethylallyltransferase
MASSIRSLIVLLGATASGKTALSLELAERFSGEIVSCDSVAVYRGMELGTAKPTLAERALVQHHCIDIHDPDQPCTAGDYARHGREALAGISGRGHLPIVAGGTGLYLRALLDGLFASPPSDPALRERLRTRSPERLHGILARLDAEAAKAIHPNDVPKAIRAIEVSLAARRPMTEQWREGRDALSGYRILRIGLNPPRAELYERIDRRARAMFELGLVEETESLLVRYGRDCRALSSLGYAQAAAMLRGEMTLDEAVMRAQQGHRNYAKRQMTWFRREPEVLWLEGTGDAAEVVAQAIRLVEEHGEKSA